MTSPQPRTAEQPLHSREPNPHSSREWESYAEGVRFLALRALGDVHAAEDVSQETVLRAWRASVARRGEPIDNPAAFVYGIARHVIADAQRDRGRIVSIDMAIAVDADDAGALDALVTGEERLRVRRALRQLPRVDRILLEMSYVAGLTSAAIAVRLGESADSVRKKKSRILQRLRAALSDE